MQNKTIEVIVRIIIERDNKILLCKNKKHNFYFLPGGHVEFGDTFEKTVYKEMGEELGIKKEQITNILYKNYLEEMYTEDGNDHHEINIIFTAKIPNNIEVKSKENHIDFEWIDIKDIKNIKLLPAKIAPLLFN